MLELFDVNYEELNMGRVDELYRLCSGLIKVDPH